MVVTEHRVKLSIKQLERLLAWLKANDVNPDRPIEIRESHQSGIGPSHRAELEISEDEGKYLDLTDISSW